jgi:hypothetical protein
MEFIKKEHMQKLRLDNEQPLSIEKWGWKYHHLGIPTKNTMPGEIYLSGFGVYVSGFSSSPFGIEWMRFEEGSPVNALIQSVPHIAFEVTDLDHELSIHDLNIITEPNSPSDGTRVAMIEHNGAPIELIEFGK